MSLRVRRGVVSVIFCALVGAGCSASDSSSGPVATGTATSVGVGGGDAPPTEVLVQTIDGAGVSQAMGPDGVDLAVDSPTFIPGAGAPATVRLAIPAGSVPDGTTVTVTPVSAIKVGDRTWRVVAGATFEPDGTQLSETGAFLVTLPVPAAQQMSLITWGGGKVRTIPVQPGQTEIGAPVDHFSGMVLVSDPAGEASSGVTRESLMNDLGNDPALAGASTNALNVASVVDLLLKWAKAANLFGNSEYAERVLNNVIAAIEVELDRMAATCPNDVKGLKTAMKRLIEIYASKGIVLPDWDAARVDKALSQCDRYTIAFEGRAVASGGGQSITQMVSGTVVATVIDDETTYGEGTMYSELVGSGVVDWKGKFLQLVNQARAENGVGPCTAHDVPGRIEVGALDVSRGDVLSHVSLNLYDAIHDWGGPFGCESIDGGFAIFADALTALGRTNPVDFSLNERTQGWDGHLEYSGSADGANIEVDMRVAVLRTPGAPLTKGGPKGPAVGVGRPTYDHYQIYNDDQDRLVETAWDSSTGASVTFYPEFDSTDEYAGMDGGWDGETTVPTDNPFEGDGGDAPRPDDSYWEQPWDPFEGVDGDGGDGGSVIIDDTVPDDTVDDGSGGGTDDTVDDGGGGGGVDDTEPPATDPPE